MTCLKPTAFAPRLANPLATEFGGRGVAPLTTARPSFTAIRTVPGIADAGGVILWPVGVRHGRR